MTEGHRATPSATAIRFALAGLMAVGAALIGAASSAADPEVPTPTPIPADPAIAAPGEAAVPPADSAAAPPPPAGPPSVPEIANPVYGSGQNGGGVLGTLKDLWHQARDPYYAPDGATGPLGGESAPPPGAGSAPPLPPGYISLNAPGSETASTGTGSGGGATSGGPPLPPGYYPLNGPPPPGYEFNSQTPGAPQSGAPQPAPPTPTVIVLPAG